MDVDTVSFFFAIVTVAALAGTVAMVVALIGAHWSAPLRRLRDYGLDLVGPSSLWLAWMVAAVSVLGSLYYSEIADLPPCDLCWWQRIGIYPLALILAFAAFHRDAGVRRYVWPLTLFGGAMALYHYLYQFFPSLQSGLCGIDGPDCGERIIWEFGFVSFPFMSLVSFALIAVLLWVAKLHFEEDE